jgi:prepilin-type processing-associated H-X9-DG protein
MNSETTEAAPKNKNTGKILILRIIVIVICLLVIAFSLKNVIQKSSVESRKSPDCVNNLKQIGLGLHMYASDYSNYFPPGDNVKGLNKLVKLYLGRNNKVLICPLDQKRSAAPNIVTEADSSYIYLDPECDLLKIKKPSTTVIVFDKPGNHFPYVSVLYVDGHVQQFETKVKSGCETALREIYKNDFSEPLRKRQLEKARAMDKENGY